MARRKAKMEGVHAPKVGINRRRQYKKEVRARLRKTARDGCTGKVAFKDPEAALAAAVRMVERSTKAAGVYVCRKCGDIHITSKPRGGANELYLVEREEDNESHTDRDSNQHNQP